MRRADGWLRSTSNPGSQYRDDWWVMPRRERVIFRWWDVYRYDPSQPNHDSPWVRHAGGYSTRRAAKQKAEQLQKEFS